MELNEDSRFFNTKRWCSVSQSESFNGRTPASARGWGRVFIRNCVLFVISLALAPPAFSQRRVDATQMYQRVYIVVPMVGSGTWSDPKRPALMPASLTPGNRSGIIAFNQVASDDGQFALVEVVCATNKDLANVLSTVNAQASQITGFQVFQKATSTPAQVQTAFQALKKNFDITKFRVVVP